MKVSDVKGLSTGPAVRRTDSVIAGVPATAARRQAFQAKLAVAGKRLSSSTAETAKRGSIRRTTSANQEKAPNRSVESSNKSQATTRRSIEKRSHVTAQRCTARSPVVLQRIRRFRKSTSEDLRNKIFQLSTNLGLTLVDVWSDTTQRSVTLIVEQSGYSKTRFEIEYDNTTWQVIIHSELERDRNGLLAEGEALQARFDAVNLGAVAVAKSQE